MIYKLETTLKLLREADACKDGLETLISSLPKDYPQDKPINLLHILNSNGVDHCFWAFRALITENKEALRMIMYDVVDSIRHIYESKYPDSTVIKDVLEALKTGKNLEDAANAAHNAANAAYNAANAAHNAANAAHNAANAAHVAADAANAVADVTYAVKVAYDAYDAYDVCDSYDAYDAAANAAHVAERKKQEEILKKWLK